MQQYKVTLTDLRKTGTLLKTSYYAGDAFDPSGLTFTAYYSNGSSKNVTGNVVFNPATMVLGTTKVVASFTSGSITKTQFLSSLSMLKIYLSFSIKLEYKSNL